ncbi:MAG: fadM [Bacillales bacterium]|nr:fadM [Bacillales bacterium]
MEKVLKNLFLYLSKNKLLNASAKKVGLKFGAKRFIAGETFEQAAKKIKKLNDDGLVATVDYVGEFIETEKEANEMTEGSINAIKTIRKYKLNSHLSLKMTSMGMDISDEVVLRNMRRILDAAKENNVYVTIDMEDYSHCQKTIDIFHTLAKEYKDLGTVIQSYLYRSEQDVEDLSQYAPMIRFVKGAYKESSEVAYPDKKDIDENLKKLIKQYLKYGHYTMVASHDEKIIDFTKEYAKENNIPKSQFEFQMLYGICVELQKKLVKEGYTVRIYVPYGTDWYGYFMRRLAEKPSNVMLVLKGLFK